MDNVIDCLLIGHNEMDFSEYLESVKKMGIHSGAYRDLTKNFIQYNHKPYPISEIFNLFYCCDDSQKRSGKLSLSETFSAAVAYLGTYLHKRGFTFDYVNSFQDEKEELKEKLMRKNILTIGIITTLYVSPLPIFEIVDFIKKYNHTAKIIVGGPFVSTHIRVLDDEAIKFLFESSLGADIYVDSSQGESTLVQIIRALKQRLPLHHVPNIYYKTDDRYRPTPTEREDNNLSENMVDWNLFQDRVNGYVNIRTSISCPFSCAFCGFPEHAGKYQTADIAVVEKELNSLRKIEPLKSLHIVDDTFNVPVKRFKAFLGMMIKNEYGFRWHSQFRCQFADRETVKLMKESGCEGVFLGLESGNDQILKNMNKAASVEKYRQGIALLKEYGILTYGSFIIGFPGETEDTVIDTVKLIEESGIDYYRTQLWYCEPITPIWKQRKTYNIEGFNFEWSHSTMDVKKACDLIDEIFFTVKNAIWVPQYNFEFDGLFHLLNRGMSLEQVNDFIKSFNQGVEEKMKISPHKDVSFEVIKKLKRACGGENGVFDPDGSEDVVLGKYEADFNF